MKANKARSYVRVMKREYGSMNVRLKAIEIAEEELTERSVNVIRNMFPGEYEIIERFRNELEEEE